MTKRSNQKCNYLEKEKSFKDEIESIFHQFERVLIKLNETTFFGKWKSNFNFLWKMPNFHRIFYSEIWWKNSFCATVEDRLKPSGNCAFPPNFHTKKFDEIKIFYAEKLSFLFAVLMKTSLEELINTKPKFNFFLMVIVNGMHLLCLLSPARLMLGKILTNFINLRNVLEIFST